MVQGLLDREQEITRASVLGQDEYIALHDGVEGLEESVRSRGFSIERVGESTRDPLQDIGLDYYRFDP